MIVEVDIDVDEVIDYVNTEDLINILKSRCDLKDYKEDIQKIYGCDINLDELDHSLFYMSQDDFSKLLKIVEYHKEHRNG
jgi:hypothetical protein